MKTGSLIVSLIFLNLIVSIARAQPAAFDHSLFDRLLQKYVKDGMVDYAAMKNNENLDAYLEKLSNARPELLSSGDEQTAFWINAYNAIVVKTVLAHYPLKRPLDVPGFFDTIRHRVAGKQLTLDQIEKRAVRKTPLAHFGLVCGARGCPPLGSRAFTGKNVASMLEKNARAFLAGPPGVVIDRKTKIIRLSELFRWYADDLEKQFGSIENFLARFGSRTLIDMLKVPGIKFEYSRYDWRLNDIR